MNQAVHCCGHSFTRRHWMWSAMAASVGALFAGCSSVRGGEAPEAASDARLAAAQKFLKDNISVDVHIACGPTGVTSQECAERRSRRSMRAGGMAVFCPRRRAGRPDPGEEREQRPHRRAPAGTGTALHVPPRGASLDGRARRPARRPPRAHRRDLKAAHAAGSGHHPRRRGARFPRLKLERLEESYRRGVRTMQLVHYTRTTIGDFPDRGRVHNGLTPSGADVIRACNRLASWWTSRMHGGHGKAGGEAGEAAAAVTHALRGSKAQGPTPLTERQITPDHARMIAETGGAIGIWHFFASPSSTWRPQGDGRRGGVDHVSLGSDHGSSQGLLKGYGTSPRWSSDAARRLLTRRYREDRRRQLPADLRRSTG